MDLSRLKWGWRKDELDERDFSIRCLAFPPAPALLPKTYQVNPLTPIYDQGDTSACVGYSSAGAKTDQEFVQHHSEIIFDGEWLYKECKRQDGHPNMEGTFLRTACGILQKQGMKQFSLPGTAEPDQPPLYWGIKAYYRIGSSANLRFIKQVIFEYGTILVGSEWYENWLDVKAILSKPTRSAGGHAYRVSGWNEVGFVIPNTWGREWGVSGISTMPYEMFAKYVLPEGDIWKIIDR